MSPDMRLLSVLLSITDIANDKKHTYEDKLNKILLKIVDCMSVKSGSIMMLKNRKTLEVVASTRPQIVGFTQKLDELSPSAWVVKNKQPLYVESCSKSDMPLKHLDHYRGEAFYLVPIMDRGGVKGVINVTEKVGTDSFDKKEQEILLSIVGHVIVAHENHRLAQSLKKKKNTLQKKNTQLRKLERLRTDLFNMLIHDLKGPISEIIANLDILSYTITDENLEFVETAKVGCNTLYNMVTNLLDIARLEEGKLVLVYEEIPPRELIKEALARLLISVRQKGLRFAEEFPSADGLTLQADRAMLIRVLQNFLTNAIYYSPDGATITVGYQCTAPGKVAFFVKDNGPGVPEDAREAIFDKFTQLDKKDDGRIYTTGLGLSFCKLAVEAHKGTIGVESGDQKGSRFFFVIPTEAKKR